MVVAAVKAGPASGNSPAAIDTGSLRGDLLALLARLENTMDSGRSISLVLLKAGLDDPELCEHLEKTAGPTGARLPENVIQAAIKRGELPENANPFVYEEVAGAVILLRKLNGLTSDAVYREQLTDTILIPSLTAAVTPQQRGIFSGSPTPATSLTNQQERNP